MDIAKTPALERIARVLAGQRLSANAGGVEPSAAPDVDAAWSDYCDDALAVLKTLREPDEIMAAAGDPAVWERMIAAALGNGFTASIVRPFEPPEPGTDPLHEGP
ncbi:hypothetical protein ACFB49_26700 [Sphingomonas sp. DBB INV C78]|uniref:hypothetical protein n=1 Tax=Sphingomonas sp. DBB INV C78 TaxID=3349434 RepID=UPI0036D2F29A